MLLLQERRRRLACHQVVGELGEQYELQSFATAVNHAFAQPDTEYLMSGGLPTLGDDAEVHIAEAGVPLSNSTESLP